MKDKNPQLPVTQLLSALTSTGVAIMTGCGGTAAKPRIQVDAALDSIAAPPPKAISSILLLLLGG